MVAVLDKDFNMIILKMLKELKEGMKKVKKTVLSKMEIPIKRQKT